MKAYVQIGGESVLVNAESESTVAELVNQALKKYKKLTNGDSELKVVQIFKTCSFTKLNTEDLLKDVINDGEIVSMIIETDSVTRLDFNVTGHDNEMTVGINMVKNRGDNLLDYHMKHNQTEILELDGESLTTEDLVKCGRGFYKLKLSKRAEKRIIKARCFLNIIVEEERTVYGITTGFGNFANVTIPIAKVYELQENLIRSNCCGVGQPMSPYRGRMMLALRINILAKGRSGVSLEVVHQLIDAFNGEK